MNISYCLYSIIRDKKAHRTTEIGLHISDNLELLQRLKKELQLEKYKGETFQIRTIIVN